MLKAFVRPQFLACALALGGCVQASGAAASGKGRRPCGPLLGLVDARATYAPSSPAPEPTAYAHALGAPALDPEVARHARVRAGELILKPHLSITLEQASSLKPVRARDLDPKVWADMVRLMSGSPPDVMHDRLAAHLANIATEPVYLATLRIRLPAATTLPFASLSLGIYHYAIELRSRVSPPRSRNQTRLLDLRTYGAQRRPPRGRDEAEFLDPIPGGLTRRGVFKGQLVGLRIGDVEIEPVLRNVDPVIANLRGTWHFENEWLTLRLHVSDAKLRLLKQPPY